jgi:hypothetical protein
MDPDAALHRLREALSSYDTYRESVDAGRIPVNADDDPEMLVDAAAMNVEQALNECLAAGLTRHDISAHFGIEGRTAE